MAYLIVLEQGKKKKFEITEEFLFIGRTPENQVRISDPKASRQHCQIIKTDRGYRLIDLGSQYGTIVGKQKVTQKDLADMDIIQIGDVKIQIKDIDASTAPAPAAAPAPVAAPQAAPVTARRGGARRGAAASRQVATRRAEPEPEQEITISEEMAEAARTKTHLRRRNPAKASKIPGWAQAVIAFWVVVMVVVVVFFVIKTSSSPWGAVYKEALDLWETQHDHEAAYTKFESIPFDDPVYGDESREKMKEIIKERDAGNLQYDAMNASRNFANINNMIENYIDAPLDKPKKGIKISRDYADSRSSYVRVLIKNRLNPFLERFPTAPQAEEVRKYKAKYSREVNLDAPPTFRDVEVEGECLLRLNGYGEAYQIMSRWMADHPGEFVDRAQFTFNEIQRKLESDWRPWEKEVTKFETTDRPKIALKHIDRFLRLTEGLDSPEGRTFREALLERKANNEARVEVLSGGGG